MSSALRHWPFVIALLSAAMLAIAHGFQTFGHMAPCELCLKEREVWWVVLALALAGGALAARSPSARGRVLVLLVAALAVSFLLAGYHAGVEWKWWPGPQSCSGSAGAPTIADMRRLLKGASFGIVRCDQPAWIVLGLSMAGWNAVVSLIAAGSTLGILARRRR